MSEGFKVETGLEGKELPYEIEKWLVMLERSDSDEQFQKSIDTFNKSHDFHQGPPVKVISRILANGRDVTITFYENTIEVTGGRSVSEQKEAA